MGEVITIYRGVKIRLYPTKQQEEKMWKHIHASRYIWNYMLELNISRYKNGETHLYPYDMNNLLKPLKTDGEHDWLKEINHTTMQIVCNDLQNAYNRYFKGISNFPKFKSKKRSKNSFPIRPDRTYFKSTNTIQISSIGIVRFKSDRVFETGNGKLKIVNPRIKYVLGKWMLSLNIDVDKQDVKLNDYSVGIDLGIKEFAVVAYNKTEFKIYHNINKTTKMKKLEKLKIHYQRDVWRKKEMAKVNGKYSKEKSKNEERSARKFKKICMKISNIRDNYIHHVTSDIIKLKPKRIVIETLCVSNMVKNKTLAKHILEQNFSKFKTYLSYKCEQNGIELVYANKFYPSSKTCSNCGFIKKTLSLKDRVYICDKCGFIIDRDKNAAINLMNYK